MLASVIYFLAAVLVVLLGVVAVMYARFIVSRWRLRRLPHGGAAMAPDKFPLGCLGMFKDGLLQAYSRWAQCAGPSGVGLAFFFNSPKCIVQHHEDVKTVLLSSTFRERVDRFAHPLEEFLGRRSLALIQNDEWKWHRRLMSSAFKYDAIKSMAKGMVACTMGLVRYLKSPSVVEARQRGPVDLFPCLKAMTLDIISRSAFGFEMHAIEKLGRGEHRIWQAFEDLQADTSRRQFSPNPLDRMYWLPTEKNREFHAKRKLLKDVVDEVVRHRRASADQDADFLHHMLRSRDESSSSSMSEESLVDNLVTLMFAGFDTTSLALAFTCHLLSTHLDTQRRVQEEVSQVLGSREATHEDEKQLVFTQCVIREALRLYPPAPITTRTLTADVTLADGLVLPKGMDVTIPIFLVHRFAENYKNPDEFEPDRWLPENRASIPLHAWVPFSGGRRDCIGRRFAMLEATLALATLMQHFELRPDPNYVFEPVAKGVIMAPRNGLSCFVVSRDNPL